MADLTKEFVQEIAKMNTAANHYVEVGGFHYTNSPHWSRVQGPKVTPLGLGTLDGLVTYAKEVSAEMGDDAPMFIIDNPARVAIGGHLTIENERSCYAVAVLGQLGFSFGEWFPQEAFIIGLQTQFLPTPLLDQLLKVVSSITSEDVRVSMDDGVSQEVTVKASLAKMDRATLPTRIELQPWRTFRDVNQPASDFLLRARKDSQGGVKLALFEADGGVWMIEAIKNIHEFLATNCPGIPVLY